MRHMKVCRSATEIHYFLLLHSSWPHHDHESRLISVFDIEKNEVQQQKEAKIRSKIVSEARLYHIYHKTRIDAFPLLRQYF